MGVGRDEVSIDAKDVRFNMLVVIRVDSSAAIGSGHLMRCLTLADKLKSQGAEVHFVSRDLPGNLSYLILERNYILHLLAKKKLDQTLVGYAKWLTVTQECDARETINIIKSLQSTYGARVDQLVVDSYAIDSIWENLLRPFVDKIFVIDDLANRKHDCDFLLDQDLYDDMENRYKGLVPDTCCQMIGPQYILLREEFYRAREKMILKDGNLKNILIFYGGIDITNETTKALKALMNIRNELPDVTIDVIVGSKNPHKEEVRSLCLIDGNRGWIAFHEQVDNIADYMCKADLSFGAGGTTMWERCFLELPTIVTAVADNQIEACKVADKYKIIKYLGKCDDVKEINIINVIKQCRDTLIEMKELIKQNFVDKYNF